MYKKWSRCDSADELGENKQNQKIPTLTPGDFFSQGLS
jgi:hypothetical protein